MRKSLLIAVAAIFVAVGANAQSKRIAQATKVATPVTFAQNVQKATTDVAMPVAKSKKAKAPRKAVANVAGSYILDFLDYYGEFTESSSFTITAESGTTKVIDVETDQETVDFEYNVRLNDFTYAGGVAYGYYDEAEAEILVPAQTIYTHATYGRVVLSGVTKVGDSPAHIGFDLLLEVGEDGNLSLYDFADELAEAGFAEGEYMSGWYSYLPDYAGGGAWNYGFDIEMFAPNAIQGDNETHISNGNWTAWESVEYDVYVEDYGDELVVHNFLGLTPISITVEGDQGTIATPVRVMSYDYADDGAEDPDYMQIWQWDETFENIINPGAITGTISELEDGRKILEFYDVEYKEAWDDESGSHEAGYYYVKDYTKWFMVHSTYNPGTGAYWWGEARYAYVIWNPATDGISNITNEGIANKDAKTYNLAGQQVGKDYKGIVIKNGVKTIQK